MLEVRNASAYDGDQERITENKNTMEHTIDYANEQPRPKVIVDKINQVRLWKRVILRCEVLGLYRTKTTDCGERDEDQSILKWNFKMPKVYKPNRSYIRKWRNFVSWLRNQEMSTKIDFMKYSESKWQVSRNRRMLK